MNTNASHVKSVISKQLFTWSTVRWNRFELINWALWHILWRNLNLFYESQQVLCIIYTVYGAIHIIIHQQCNNNVLTILLVSGLVVRAVGSSTKVCRFESSQVRIDIRRKTHEHGHHVLLWRPLIKGKSWSILHCNSYVLYFTSKNYYFCAICGDFPSERTLL